MNNPPAFPVVLPTDYHPGMSLRDYFAAHLASAVTELVCKDEPWRGDRGGDEKWRLGVAGEIWAFADAMLATRKGGAA